MGNRMNKLFFIFFSFLLQYTIVQGIEVYLVAAEVTDISEEFFLEENTFSYVDTDVDPAVFISNVTFIKSPPPETKLTLTLHGYSMGEYRIPVGMDYISPLCEVFDEKLILDPAMRVLGFTPENCPPSPGTYMNAGYYPNLSQFPESFPRNQYVVKLEMKLKDKIIGTVKVYIEVV